jgi:hypothetical protein
MACRVGVSTRVRRRYPGDSDHLTRRWSRRRGVRWLAGRAGEHRSISLRCWPAREPRRRLSEARWADTPIGAASWAR